MMYFTGRVTDLQNQEVLPGANIYFLYPDGSVNYNRPGTSSELDGTFDLAINEGDIIRISFIGYHPQDVEVDASMIYEEGGSVIFNPIELEESIHAIPEAVIVAAKTAWYQRPELYVILVLLVISLIAVYRYWKNG